MPGSVSHDTVYLVGLGYPTRARAGTLIVRIELLIVLSVACKRSPSYPRASLLAHPSMHLLNLLLNSPSTDSAASLRFHVTEKRRRMLLQNVGSNPLCVGVNSRFEQRLELLKTIPVAGLFAKKT